MCARQVVGKAACVPQARPQTSRGKWPTRSDALESSGASSGGRSHTARWAGRSLPLHIAKNTNQLLSFNEKSCEPGSVFSVDQFISGRTLRSRNCYCSHFTDEKMDSLASYPWEVAELSSRLWDTVHCLDQIFCLDPG